jgi:hypothetical protein
MTTPEPTPAAMKAARALIDDIRLHPWADHECMAAHAMHAYHQRLVRKAIVRARKAIVRARKAALTIHDGDSAETRAMIRAYNDGLDVAFTELRRLDEKGTT